MPSASYLFLSCFCYRKLLLEIFSELDENLRGFFIRQMMTGAKRATEGVAHRLEATCGRALGSTRAWDPPLLCGAPLSLSFDTYKIIPDEKTLTPEGFSQICNRAPPPLPTSFGGFRRSCSGTLPGRGSTTGAISINAAASRDEEGVVPHRG